MGKASTSKAVARAARAGGSKTAKKRTWTFPAAIALIIVVGVSIAFIARSSNQTSTQAQASEAPVIGDHWHAAYGIYVCDAFLPPVTDVAADQLGIHTHGDGIMHVHPFSLQASGKNAQFKVFSDTTNLTFQDHGFTQDRLAFTIAVVPEGTDVPKPDSIPELDKLTDVAGATSSTVAATPSTTAAPASSSTTASTAAP